jgi:Carboxypeptidase regulatory-like domain
VLGVRSPAPPRQPLPSMRRLALALAGCVVAGWIAPAAGATTGTIRGRVVSGATRRPEPGVRVTLTAGSDGSQPVERSAITDRAGRFEFGLLPTGDDLAYALDARFDGGLFAGGAVSLPSGGEQAPVIETTLRVWRTTTEPGSIVVDKDLVFVVPSDEGAGAIESVAIDNTSERAYIGRGAGAGRGRAPTLGLALVAGGSVRGLQILEATLDVPEITPDADLGGFTTTMAIPPGPARLVFTYPVSGAAGQFDLSRRALYPVLDYRVFVADPLTVRSDGLRPSGEVRLKGKTYRRYDAPGGLDAGDTVQALALAEAGLDPGLVAGAGAVAAIVLGAVAVALRRRGRGGVAPQVRQQPRARAELVEAIAELDLRRRSGEVDQGEWMRRRAELKARLERMREPEPTP